MAKKERFVALGSIMVKKEKDSKGRNSYYMKLDDAVKITINGRPYNNKYIQVSRPTDKYDRMFEKGTITEDTYEEKVSAFDKDGRLSYVSLELSAEFKDE